MNKQLSLPKGAYFEDFAVGQEMVTRGRTITEADVVNFAGLSGDFHPLHTDEVYAGQQIFGQRVAHGVLGLSVATGLAMGLGVIDESIIAFRELRCRFSKPIFIGDTIYVRLLITRVKAMPRLNGGLVELDVKVYNQRDQVVQSGSWTVLSRNREAG